MHKILKIWGESTPLCQGQSTEDNPVIRIYKPKKPNGAAMLICPGGAYCTRVDWEKQPVALWMNERGITAIIVEYRVGPRYNHPVPWLDISESIRLVRSKSQEIEIDPDRIGIIGFSAGGHAAASAAVYSDLTILDSHSNFPSVSHIPNVLVLVYPVIDMLGKYIHVGSKTNLLGSNPSLEICNTVSLHLQVHKSMPPTFLVHAMNDEAVPCQNSLLFALALREYSIPLELHIFDKDGHGFGMFPKDKILAGWPDLLHNWLEARKFV